jgi:signal transduction histidine kinase
MRSLEHRLQLGLAASLVVLIAAAWWIGHAALHRAADAFVISRLEHDAEALLGAMSRRDDGRLHVGQQRLTPVYQQPYSGHYFVIETADGHRLRSRSLWDQDLAGRALAPGTFATWHAEGPEGQRLLVRGAGYALEGLEVRIAVAEDITPMAADVVHIERLLAALAIGGLLAMLLLQRLIVHRAFATLGPVYRDIAQLEAGRTVALTEDVPSEILPLVRKLNRLLLLMTQRLERSRTAAGNLAHAIKGPLSLLRQQLLDPALCLSPDARSALTEQVEQVHRMATRQLKRARLAGAGGAGVRFDPAEELPTLARLLERIHAPKALDIAYEIRTSGALELDREDMLELLGNLLDNACKWASARVRCRIDRDLGLVRLRVEDDGPGCSPDEIAAITDRGVRLDEEVTGHGLGLAIVKEIVDSYGGEIAFERSSALGGLAAEVRLPTGRV